MKKLNFLLFAIFASLIFASCTSVYHDSDPLPAGSSTSFTKAKYLTELIYITRDKTLVEEYRVSYMDRTLRKPKFRELNKWSSGKNSTLVIATIDLFLDLEFRGQ